MLRIAFMLVLAAVPALAKERPPSPFEGPQGLAVARVDGKYRLLLRRIEAKEDHRKYGNFHEFGEPRQLRRYKGHRDLPAGYWVYAYPYWYIWAQRGPTEKAPWSAAQATGAPDTLQGGDAPTAWASRLADGRKEWLMLGYERFVRPIGVLVYENLNPGALTKVTVFKPDGTEVTVFESEEPGENGENAQRVQLIPVRVDFEVVRIQIHLDSRRVRGWNEIDAVGLLDERGRTHWAHAASASSEWKTQPLPIGIEPRWIPTPFPLPPSNEVEQLRRKVAELEKRLKELEDRRGSKR